MQMTKKITSIVLAVLMVVSMMVVIGASTASAATNVAEIVGGAKYTTLEAAFAAAQDGDTINVLADSTGNGIKVPQTKFQPAGLTVDFKGFTYEVTGTLVGSTGTETQAFQLLKDNNLTFKNGTITSKKALFLVQNYSNLTLNNMTLTLNNPDYAYAYTLSNNNGETHIVDSTINANPAGGFAFDACRYSSYPSVSVSVEGTSTINGDVEVSASGNNLNEGLSLSFAPTAQITGEVEVPAALQTKIDEDVNSSFNPATVPTVTPAAKIGSAEYATLEAAWKAANDGDTIILQKNSAGNGLKAPEGKFKPNGLTVDFNSYSYDIDGDLVGSTGTVSQAFQLLKDNTITFKNGTITSSKARMLVQNYSNLTLDKMTLTPSNPTQTNYYTLSNNNGDVTIKDTTINANATANSFAFDVCRYASYPSVNVTVTGSSQINGDVEVYASNSDAKDGFSLNLESGAMTGDIVVHQTAANVIANTPEKVEVAKASTFAADAPEGYKWVDGTDGQTLAVKYVAQIGANKYETLEEAFANAADGDTIELLATCSGNGIKAPQGKFQSNGLTVDFNGFTYTVDGTTVGSTGTETQGFQLLKDNKITFKDGAITGDSNKTTSLKFLIQNYSDLTLDNMDLSLTGRYYNQYTLSNNNGEIEIKDSTINAPDYSWAGLSASDVTSYAFDVCRYASYPSVSVTVTGNSVINGDVEVSASNDDAKSGLELNLVSGTMNGDIVLDSSAEAAMAADPEKATVEKKATFDQAAPEGYEWAGTGATQVLTKLGLQAHADELDATALTGLSFVDGTALSAPVQAHKANLLGVQLREAADKEYADEGDGSKDLRFIAALDKNFLASLSQDATYGFTVTVDGKDHHYDCTGTYNNVISGGKDDAYEYVTLAIYNITQDTKDFNVKFFVKDGDTAYAFYKADSAAGQYTLKTNYSDVASHVTP